MKSILSFNQYIFENVIEGKEKGNKKYGPLKCDDCGYKSDGYDFQKIFSKRLKCPKCKSYNISDVERPNVAPAPQVRNL